MQIAKRNNKEFKTFLRPKRITIRLELTPLEYKKLCVGSYARSMEEKWFDFVEDDVLYCYRSWTSNQMFQAQIEKKSNGDFLISEFNVETHKDRIKDDSDEWLRNMFTTHIKHLTNRKIRNTIADGLLGFVVADALGVPVEFKKREYLRSNRVSGIMGYGTYNQPPGTWSDDSTMTFCLAETLLDEEFSLRKLSNRFINWVDVGYWTPHGELFDIGNTTHAAIERLRTIDDPTLAGGRDETENGNGSLMRVLPLMYELYDEHDSVKQYELISNVSSLTHGHIRSVLACFYYLTFARLLRYSTYSLSDMYKSTNIVFQKYVEEHSVDKNEVKQFGRLLSDNIDQLEEQEIRSTGYVIDTLEASIWCLLTTRSYKEAVLKAVNLGEDTDTVGAVTGGLAGLKYGVAQIPEDWIQSLAKLDEINRLIDRLSSKYNEARC